MAQTNILAENPWKSPLEFDLKRIILFLLDAADEIEDVSLWRCKTLK